MRFITPVLAAMILTGVAWADDTPDPAALVLEVRAAESWVDHVDSIDIKIDSHWHRTPAGVEARMSQLRKQFPQTQPTTQMFPDLIPDSDGNVEIAWDKSRLYYRTVTDSWMKLDLRFWDGKRSALHENFTHQEDYAFDVEPYEYVGRSLLMNMAWPRAGIHDYWWVPAKERLDGDFLGRAEDFRLAGREHFRGKDCWKLECDWYYWTWHVGVADHRLYGIDNRATRREDQTQIAQLAIQVAKDFGKQVSSDSEYEKWLEALSAKQKHDVESAWWKAMRPFSRAYIDEWMDDYKEVTPGCFIPMTQGNALRSDDGKVIHSETTMKLKDVRVNQPLPDSLFQMEMTEGVEVNDWGHKPPLHYKYKKHFEPEEWQAILEKAAADAKANNAYEHAGDSLVGQEAMEFPKTEWLNSKPLALADLKGKVVLVAFFAEWCGPCRNEYPTLADLHKSAATNGLTIIGIHPPGSEKSKIEKLVKDFDLTFPIYIDVRDKSDSSWGELMKFYQIQGIPQSFVIGPDGKIAGHGSLAQVAEMGRDLVAKTRSASN